LETTGVVRKIDELGRIVVPKEIRKTLGIKTGQSIEMYIDKDKVVLKKFSSMNSSIELARIYVETLYRTSKNLMIITDNDTIIAIPSHKHRDFLNEPISDDLVEFLKGKRTIKDNRKIRITENKTISGNYIITKIIANGEVLGLVILISDKELDNKDETLTQLTAELLSKKIED